MIKSITGEEKKEVFLTLKMITFEKTKKTKNWK